MPPRSGSSSAAKIVGLSKSGQHRKSIVPSVATSAIADDAVVLYRARNDGCVQLAMFGGNYILDQIATCIHAAFLLGELRMKSPQGAPHFTDLPLWFETAMANEVAGTYWADQLRLDRSSPMLRPQFLQRCHRQS
ncbi:hypothetical protein ACCT14_26000 [Rhizobium brockwellii]|jgi:hypothetical protein|uniref:Uncharacterized protein n=2 Tax=Rhizobium/Agrobacterium group TaxID=227290 RepID=A0ABU3YQZ2_9HYPH|nr:hypothetical protein [Rhizobium brockwellii]MDV4182377.1 hypothetical protein [Rhizobium brockwellii]MDV4188214.1 hypothetical protein [Rhizobium brockwellii]